MLNNKICNICTMYNPVKTISEEEFKYYFNLVGSNGLICGDFNAHNSLWSNYNYSSSGPSKNTGISLRSTYEENTIFNILTPKGLITYTKNNINTTLDLAFGSGIFNDVLDVTTHLSLGSDHLPITYSFNLNSSSIPHE